LSRDERTEIRQRRHDQDGPVRENAHFHRFRQFSRILSLFTDLVNFHGFGKFSRIS
jgi:hypothetical protein